MHFREKGNRIQFIRTTYDPETKRSKYNFVGAMAKSAREVGDDVLELLTEDERREVRVFIDSRKGDALLEGKLYSHRLPHVVSLILDYARVADAAEKELILAHISRAVLEFNSFARKERR